MSKKKLPVKLPPAAPGKNPQLSLWDRVNDILQRHERLTEIILFAMFLLFGLLLFDIKISVGGDDSAYIERGYNFIHSGEITFFQGPLYPCVLGVFIGMFGINVTALKFTSLLFSCLQQLILFLALRKRIPPVILFSVLLFIATNYYLQYYSSQTYTEALFMCLQALSLYFIFKLLDSEDENPALKHNYKTWLAAGFMMLMLSLCKSIAIVCFTPLIIYFMIKGKWKHAALWFASFLLWKIVYEAGMRLFYHAPDMGQFSQVLLKNMYYPELGTENMAGLLIRFKLNLESYFSMHLFRFFGILNYGDYYITTSYAYIVALVLITCTVYLFKKNKYLFFVSVYMLILYGGIFIGIQASNLQHRLIIILLPLTALVLFSAAYYLCRSYSRAGIVIIPVFIILVLTQMRGNILLSRDNLRMLNKNLHGDIYYGYTPDWACYLELSRWCADSLPPQSLVACRKASMSFIYGRGKRFYGITEVGETNPDSVLADFKRHGVTHFILANLRTNENVNDGKFITTLHKKLYPVYKKYPEKLKFIKVIGNQNEEPAEVYEILY